MTATSSRQVVYEGYLYPGIIARQLKVEPEQTYQFGFKGDNTDIIEVKGEKLFKMIKDLNLEGKLGEIALVSRGN